MRLHEEFRVDEPVASVWEFFEQPELVARCVPGVEEVSIADADNVNVRATQRVGPMTATFDAKITVVERVPNELIRFNAIGKSVRGAIGNVRTSNAVHLRASEAGTVVTVDGEVILAGALGSVGQKVVAKQAAKVTAEFAENLQRALGGETVALSPARGGTLAPPSEGAGPPQVGAGVRSEPARPTRGAVDPWSRVAAALSAFSAALSITVLLRPRKRSR
jgi:uncharacterized protein